MDNKLNIEHKNSQENEFSMWATYDSTVQSYRLNMIISQSLLLAVATFLLTEISVWASIAVCLIGLFQQWYIWHAIIDARTKISDFHKFNALYNFNELVSNEGTLRQTENDTHLTEETYTKNKSVRDSANRLLADITGQKKFSKNKRTTRQKLDYMLPVSYTLIWLIILILGLIKLFASL